jgi:hypothetical protein
MEFLLVRFFEDRDVILDGELGGIANHLITLSAGSVTISLDPSDDVTPREITVSVTGTTPLRPRRVTFRVRKPALVAAKALVG